MEKLALDLQGFYFKLAQIMSTRDDFLPDLYLDWTKKLQDKSPCVMPSEQVKAIVEQSLNVSTDEMFSEWDDEPIGAASIGQVHRARLRESEQEVAVKVQFPGIEEKFRGDIDTVEMFCRYLMPQNTGFFAEIKKQFATEFDGRGEAENLQLVHDNIHRSGWDARVEVPEPVHSSKEVLVMTYLAGPKLVDGVRAQFRRMAEREGKDFAQLEGEQKAKVASGAIELKEVSAQARWTRRMERLMGMRDCVWNWGIFVWNWTVRAVTRGEAWAYVERERAVNLGEVMDTLLRVHAHEIFVDGAFNGDPHPGNVLLMADGRLGLVDYGQVKRLGVAERVVYAKLMVAIGRGDKAEVVRVMTEEVGFRTARMDAEVIWRTAVFFNCRDSEDVLEGRNVSEFMEWLERSDPVQRINDEYVMVGRVSVLLRGMANAFGMKVRVSDYWAGEADKFLKSQGIVY